MYSKTSLTKHLSRVTTPLCKLLYLDCPRKTLIMFFSLSNPTTSLNGTFKLCPKTLIMLISFSKLTTSLNGPFKICPTVGRIREVLVYSKTSLTDHLHRSPISIVLVLPQTNAYTDIPTP